MKRKFDLPNYVLVALKTKSLWVYACVCKKLENWKNWLINFIS